MAKSSTAVLASIVALLWTIPVFAQKADSIALRPAFGLDYIVEQQTDFQHFRMNNMLQLNADIPISRHFSFIFSTISFAATDSTPFAEDLQVYSNIEAYNNIALAFAVAGIEWNINEEHSLFAGIRRIDEDYFCSDALALFTNSSCGGFPTVTANFDIAAYPTASAGVHYAFEKENLTLQASLYNGTGHYRFAGRENVFRIRPRSDGVFGIAQAEYHLQDSRYFLGASLHYGELYDTDGRKLRPTLWAYAEQKLFEDFTLIAAYSHSFAADSPCRNFAGIGGKYDIGTARIGVFSDYTRIVGIDEWATEVTCNFDLGEYVSLQPVFHIIDTDHHTKCIGMLRLNLSLCNPR